MVNKFTLLKYDVATCLIMITSPFSLRLIHDVKKVVNSFNAIVSGSLPIT